MGEKLVELVKAAGIVGAGGAGFPTHVKLNAKADYVIVNGAECEPLLRVDQQLMDVYSKEIVSALEMVVREVGAIKGIIALKRKYKRAIETLSKEITSYKSLEVFFLDDFYPAGDEQVTVYEVLKRIVPEGGIPLNVQTVVLNAETLLNVYKAINGEPVTDKFLTVTGAVSNPITIKVPVGMSLKEVIELAGGINCHDFAVIDGGPMMGKLLDNLEVVVKKNTKGYIVLPKDHPLIMSKKKSIEVMLREARTACCHCSLCTEVCPRNLLGHRLYPDRLMRIAGYNSTCSEAVKAESAFLCCECGLCEQACIMGLQPWKLNKVLKASLSSQGIKNSHNAKPESTSEFREYRKYPVKKLIGRLGLEKYNVEAPLKKTLNKGLSEVRLEMRQHIGAAAVPIVQVGDIVNKGQLIADIPEGKLGAKLHSSIDGRITSISENSIVIGSNR